MKKMKKWIPGILSIVISIMAIFIALISSFEIAAYSDYGFYQEEYEKYDVLSKLDMKMEDVVDVTIYMMSYLRGDEEVLSIEKEIEGKEQDFFNEQDRFHMEEVQGLFLGGLALRRGASICLIGAFLVLLILEKNWKKTLASTFQKVFLLLLAAVLVLGIAIAQNFSTCFVIFHEIFFDNDLWIFDERTDYMIRMLPEGFFYDMVVRIGIIFAVVLILLLIVSILLKKKRNNK